MFHLLENPSVVGIAGKYGAIHGWLIGFFFRLLLLIFWFLESGSSLEEASGRNGTTS